MTPLRSTRALYGNALKRRRRNRLRAAIGVLMLSVLALVLTNAPALHLLGSEPIRVFPAERSAPPVVAVMLSGDMGFNHGMSGDVARAIAGHGVPVVGIASPVVFARHRSQAEALAFVTQTLRSALARTGAQRAVLLGHSFGADVVAALVPKLPADILARLQAIVLTVPAHDVYFRADPSGLAYIGHPDARPAAALKTFRGPPVTCIYGLQETDSLCPQLAGSGAHVLGLPGNHYLQHDHARLDRVVLAALHLGHDRSLSRGTGAAQALPTTTAHPAADYETPVHP
ncbi:AcvB/VirJ family lysyl-phosphatidylglycerol hydrolase [Novosphingobium sp. 9U]|uniref:AcvB/VirJ family lysyl-phosphatidylglycerol hydrolase n=1 Tax=Novosphingobium sp. 9U TaxID=2653158 RepID=UPI0012EF6826|nr:AcvB/VirJ family lysyl-phosphatidylglycerol hydrolase [Novosphingobium sp. 9U]VWX47210.1 Type IV secretory pathway, VirJ component [Novosphingobium sp. 9U]